MAVAYQNMKDYDKAKAAFEKVVANKKAPAWQKKDAQNQLKKISSIKK